MVNKWLINTLSSILPGQCLHCGDDSQAALCPACLAQSRLNTSCCPVCANPLEHEHPGVCGKCLVKAPSFDQILAPYLYQPPFSELVIRFKYHADFIAGHFLARSLARVLESYLQQADVAPPDYLLPVPLHPQRLRQRGFNQSLEIARQVSRQLDIPVLADHCQRQKNTPPQRGLNEKQRKQNIKNAFSLKRPIVARSIAIIDDVITTANTVNELSQLLKQSGVAQVQVWGVCRARGPHDHLN